MMVTMRTPTGRHGDRYSGLSLVRAVNEDRVLDAVLKQGPVSRSDLGRLLGISKPTISSIINGLEEAGLVRTDGSQASGVGRPATLYTLNRQAGYVIGIDLGGARVRAILADLYGDVAEYVACEIDARSPRSILDQLAAIKGQLVEAAGIDAGLIKAAAVGVPGILDADRHRARAAYNVPALSELDLQADLTGALGVPVRVENDVNLAALGEGWRGGAVGFGDFVVIAIDTGVGMGIVLDGELFRGPSGAAGEIDFLPLGVDRDWDEDDHGPLEGAIGGPAVVARYQAARDRPGTVRSVAEIVDAAAAGDAAAAATVDDLVRSLGFAIASIVCVLDPERVVLAGAVGSIEGLLGPVRAAVARRIASPVSIETSTLADRGVAYGALAVALRQARQDLLDRRREPTNPWRSIA
jgi:predicted NBD/HSP70 family sugar kinase